MASSLVTAKKHLRFLKLRPQSQFKPPERIKIAERWYFGDVVVSVFFKIPMSITFYFYIHVIRISGENNGKKHKTNDFIGTLYAS
jgi:hypothetical protein